MRRFIGKGKSTSTLTSFGLAVEFKQLIQTANSEYGSLSK